MKYKTITFDANKPIAQQITEPTNSEYGIAVKAYKNDKVVDPSKVSISNVEKAKETEDGWSLYKLSSDGNEGMKTVEVQMTEGGGSKTDYHATNSATENIVNYAGYVPIHLSGFGIESETITVSPYDISGSYQWSVSGGEKDGESGSGTMLPTLFMEPDLYAPIIVVIGESTLIDPEGTDYFYTMDEGWATVIGGELSNLDFQYSDTITIPVADSFLVFPTQPEWWSHLSSSTDEGMVTTSVDCIISTNDDSGGSSETIKFPLYVQQKDMGYIEVESISSSGDIK